MMKPAEQAPMFKDLQSRSNRGPVIENDEDLQVHDLDDFEPLPQK
jgi:hypothetical protein